MNHVNWVQQNEDYNVEYHVTKWRSSHFHEPYARRNVGAAQIKQGAAAAAAAKEMQADAEGLGLNQADRKRSGRLGLGLGQDGNAARMLTGEENGRDGVRISSQGRQQGNAETVGAVIQSGMAAQIHAAEHTVTAQAADAPSIEAQKEKANRENTTVAGTGRGSIRNRLKESAKRLLEAYQRQKEKAVKIPLKRIRQEKPEEKPKGTREAADKEAMLAMQAENHYLLNAYDRRGNYSTLGK